MLGNGSAKYLAHDTNEQEGARGIWRNVWNKAQGKNQSEEHEVYSNSD